MMTLQSLLISVIFVLSSQILSSISFGERFRASLVSTWKMIHSGFCRKICLPLTLAPEKPNGLTLCFWDSRPNCKPYTIEAAAIHRMPLWPWIVLINATSRYCLYQFQWYRLMKVWIYLFSVLLNNLQILFMIFFSKLNHMLFGCSRVNQPF